MSRDGSLPTYRRLFGELDVRPAPAARSVHSPAAYLTELLDLVSDQIDGATLRERRPDIARIVLDAANTETEEPYLDVVNRVLESQVDPEEPYERLRTRRFPFGTPFSLPHQRLRRHLLRLGTDPADLYRLFAAPAHPDRTARERLGLAPEEVDELTVARPAPADVRGSYGLVDDEAEAVLQDLERFRRATGLSGVEVGELLWQRSDGPGTGTAGAFVHQGEPVGLDEDGTRLVAPDVGSFDWGAWFDRVSRSVRLARRTGLALADLDQVLRDCCHNVLDASALRTLAVVLDLRARLDLPVDVVCSLAAPMDTARRDGADPGPDLFDRTFNAAPAGGPARPVLRPHPGPPGAHPEIVCTGDVLAPANRAFRTRVAGALGMTEADVVTVVTRLRAHHARPPAGPSPFDRGEVGLAALSLLHRVSRLTTALGTGVDELFTVLEVVHRDPSVRRPSTFDVLLPLDATVDDPYRMLDAPDPASGLCLAQLLVAVLEWLRDSGLTGDDLAALVADDDRAERETVVADLRARRDQVALGPAAFGSPRFGERAARVLHDVLDQHAGVVSARDPRLLRLDPAAVPVAAHDAVTDLAVVTAEDLLGLDLGERSTAKLRTNLVLRGYLRADGTIVDDAVPDAGPVRPAGTFAAYRGPLYELVRALRPGGPDEDPAFLFPSDLEGLGAADGLPALDAAATDELYDNLVHLEHVDRTGEVREPARFADPDGAGFAVDVDLDVLAAPVADALRARLAAFATARVPLGRATFADLDLDDEQADALLANLHFNGYRDDTGHYRDPASVPALGVDGLALAPDLEPYRRDVLAALQAQVAAVRTTLCTVTADDLRPLVDTALAERTVAALEGSWLEGGSLRPELWPLLADRAGDPAGTTTGAGALSDPVELPALPAELTGGDREIVVERLRSVLADLRPYHLDPAAPIGLGLDPVQARQVVALLVEAGHLDEWLSLPLDRVAHFATADAAGFTLPGFADYAREVFGLLRGLARETAAATRAVADALEALAERQERELVSVLADAFALPAATVSELCRAVGGSVPGALEALVAHPAGPLARLTYRRIRTFARLAGALRLEAADVAVVFADQDLAGKFGEALVLPPGLDRFDALLESPDGTVTIFAGAACHRYEAGTLALRDATPVALGELSTALAPLVRVDAAFVRDGDEWIAGRDGGGTARTIVRRAGSTRWAPVDLPWGTVHSTFAAPERIDAAFADGEGRAYLFCGDQYVRYTDADLSAPEGAVVDEGYPRSARDWWVEWNLTPPPGFGGAAPDAAFHDGDGRLHLFAGDRCLAVGDPADRPVAQVWGRTPDGSTDRVDAAWSDGSTVRLLGGDVVVGHSDGLENLGLRADEGSLGRVATHFPDAPPGFDGGLDAVLRDPGETVHLFKDGRTARLGAEPRVGPTAEVWGRTVAPLTDGRVDAVLAGLDGCTYLFSGERYVRYSGTDYTTTDLGYPRTVAGRWGGLRTVQAAFVLDGITYLLGRAGELFDVPVGLAPETASGPLTPSLRAAFAGHGITFVADARVRRERAGGSERGWRIDDERGTVYALRPRADRLVVTCLDDTRFVVRYATRDYTRPDDGHPRPVTEDWWNLPPALGATPAGIDAVFTGRDGRTYLFAGERFVVFDARRRWWSEPRTLRGDWDALGFDRVDAAFLGRDGRTYVFFEDRYVRFSTADYTRVDDRYPAAVSSFWARVPNRLARTGQVDATLVLDAVEPAPDGTPQTRTYTYLFSGDQYVRYAGTDYATVQDGYPAPLSALASEPRLGALPVVLDRVDAAFADRRSVHLLSGDRWHVVSDAVAHTHPDVPDVRCAFVEDGALMIEGAGGWRHSGSVDAPQPWSRAARPRSLRTVPERFATGLDAVLLGADGGTYLFREANCYDVRLGVEYPVAEAWGLPRDTITRDGVVDAAFAGPDGVVHLFRRDQYVTWTPSRDGSPTGGERGGPWPVAGRWGGLSAVALAYVEHGRVHLFSPPGPDGRMQHVTCSGADRTAPDPGGPQTVGSEFWGAPPGFAPPAAVLVRDGALLLLSGERFVQRSGPDDPWSLPQPIGLLWRHDPDGPAGGVLRTAFTGHDGATHFFVTPGGPGDRFGEVVDDVTGDRYVRHADGAFAPSVEVRRAWGHPAFDRVDAAYVDPAGTTYLFSGDRYARYGAADYRDADPGYPKTIATHLRTEEPFRTLPESFEDTAAVRGVDAVIGDARSVYVFAGGQCHVAARTLYAARSVAELGRVRNTIVERGRVDAALRVDRRTFLFSGDQYVRYTDGTGTDLVDDGYPRTIEGSLADDLQLSELPSPFTDGLDAVLRDGDGGIHLFRGDHHLHANARIPLARPVTGRWGRVRNEFGPGRAPDAAFVDASGALYAFRADQYVRYGTADLTRVDPGYPRTVRDDWGDLPATFEDGIDGAFTFSGATYLLDGADHVRVVGVRYPGGSAQPLRHRFGGAVDYRLTDLHVISRYAPLARSARGALATLLDGRTRVEDPFARLGELFGWDVEEVRWLQRHRGFLSVPPDSEDRLEIELVLRMAELFAAVARLRIGPSRLHAHVWAPAFGDPADPDPDAATDGLLGLLADVVAPDELATFTARVHDELGELRRDVLVATVLAGDPAPTPGALFERLLLDVEMGAAGTTSRVREAIAATQLYVHRWLLDLEPAGVPRALTDPAAGTDAADRDARARVRRWWEWLRGYRTWEANRKVLLHPENYLRPELRDTKTPAFRQLENDLLQGGITPDAVQAAYKRYLDEYTEVSRLAIAGGYVYPPTDAAHGAQRLVLFGRTRTSPRRYYCRSGTFHVAGSTTAAWDAWSRVDVQIEAETVYPVHAFGRLFVFWATVENVLPDRPGSDVVLATKQDGARQEVSGPPALRVVKIWFSFRNLNGDWVAAQSLGTGVPYPLDLWDVRLWVRAGSRADGHQAIVVSYTAKAGNPPPPARVAEPERPRKGQPAAIADTLAALAVLAESVAAAEAAAAVAAAAAAPTVGSTFALTPELYTVTVTEQPAEPPPIADASAILGPRERIRPSDVVWFSSPEGSTGGPWFSVDHKGGSFLCRPVLTGRSEPPTSQPVRSTTDALMPRWDRIDAGVELPDGSRIFFRTDGSRYVHLQVGGARLAEGPIASRWGRTRPDGPESRFRADAALVRGDVVFVFAGQRYLRYPTSAVEAARNSGEPLGAPGAGYPAQLRQNTEGLPSWPVRAAFTGPSGREYFVAAADRTWTSSADLAATNELARANDVATTPEADLPILLGAALDTLQGSRGAVVRRLADELGITPTPFAPDLPEVDLGRGLRSVDAGFVNAAGTHLYLTSGDGYVRYTLTDGKVGPLVDDGYPQSMSRPVTALFHQGGRPYALSGELYATLPASGEPVPTGRFLRTADRWADLPTGITGALDSRDGLYLFLDDRYVHYPRTVAQQGPREFASLRHEVVRLTTSTAYKLNERLLTGGVPALLDTATQETDELPAFSTEVSDATTVQLRADRVTAAGLPGSAHLDFGSANGLYYWEIFFHAPLLIAQALNGAQRFGEARVWYEYVFDPTRQGEYWRFLPFLGADPAALAADLRDAVRSVRAVAPDLPATRSALASLDGLAARLDGLGPAFRGAATADPNELEDLARTRVPGALADLGGTPAYAELAEVLALVRELPRQYVLRPDRDGQLAAYRDDPFDPHTIAALRPTAYRRAVVMNYVDNLVDWADMLFRQYTPESVDEARMLYVLAQDLLGRRPESTGSRPLADPVGYADLDGRGSPQEALDSLAGVGGPAGLEPPYFHVPANPVLTGYWGLVADRLGKIRRSLDIMGISRPVPLFAPPLDPAALVQGVAAGGGVAAAVAATTVPVPHHRFAVVLARAQELAERVRQFGQDLLVALDRRDAEQLTLLQNRHEADILAITRAAQEAQVGMAEAGLRAARAARDAAAARIEHYDKLVEDGPSATQVAQVAAMSAGSALQLVSGGLKIGAAIAHAVPQALLGPFIIGVEAGGEQVGDALSDTADVSSSIGEGLTTLGEVLGVVAEQERAMEEWRFQATVARADLAQMEPEVSSAELSLTAARRELDSVGLQIAQQVEVAAFLRDKFTGAELAAWSAGRLGALYFRAYGMAEETARAAERAYRFERGLPENGTAYVTPGLWDDRRQGLLAGDHLVVELDRLAQAARDGHRRGLEIIKRVSLRAVDPLALLRLRSDGVCEIPLTEELFDRDFPGHYRRQVRTVSVALTGADGSGLPATATLTQVTHRTVLEPDPKAVRHLLSPQGPPPATLRVDWRADQRIALSEVPEGTENNGLHELRYDDDRYLPFEGTGAIGTWRLELTGRRPAGGLPADVVLTLRYTAEDGGAVFAAAVRGMLGPVPAARYVDVAAEFPREWERFAGGDDPELVLPLDPAAFPGMTGRQVTGLHVTSVPAVAGAAVPRLLLDGDPGRPLVDGRLTATPGLALPADGSGLRLTAGRGTDPTGLSTIVLVVTYRAAP